MIVFRWRRWKSVFVVAVAYVKKAIFRWKCRSTDVSFCDGYCSVFVFYFRFVVGGVYVESYLLFFILFFVCGRRRVCRVVSFVCIWW